MRKLSRGKVRRMKVSKKKENRRKVSGRKTSRLNKQMESKQEKFNRRCPSTVKPTRSFATERAGWTLYKASQGTQVIPTYQGQIKL